MITIVLFIVVACMLVFIIWDKDEWDPSLFIVMGFLGAFGGLFVAALIPSEVREIKDIYTLESLQDNSTTQGSFFLGVGGFNGSMKYVFYYKTDGGYKMGQLDYYDVIIRYDNSPRLEKHKYAQTESTINLFSLCVICDGYTQKVIYIPEGSIKQNYTLDSK